MTRQDETIETPSCSTKPVSRRSTLLAESHFPGFDGLRLLAAMSVLFSHAFLIATGSENDEPLVRLLGAGNIIGLYGVYTFFIMSGFLLARSLANDGSAVRFAINRILRIYPGFIFSVLVTALLLGLIASPLHWRQYLFNADTFGYVRVAISCLCDVAKLPGVYAYQGSNDLETVVNGSLWTLSYEALSYLLLVWFWLGLQNVNAVAFSLVLLAGATKAFPIMHAIIPGVAFTLPYFAGGVFMYVVQQRIGLKPWLAASCVVGLLGFSTFGMQHGAYAIFGAYLVVFLGSRPNIGSTLATRIGDLSYGVYLFGWPIEQFMKQFTRTENPWILMASAFPVAISIAAISCHFVERPSLQLKTPIANFARSILEIKDPLKNRAACVSSTLAFLVATAVILTSQSRWWFVTRTIAEVIGWSAISAALSIAAVWLLGLWRRRAKE